jgi:hypothetical protein
MELAVDNIPKWVGRHWHGIWASGSVEASLREVGHGSVQALCRLCADSPEICMGGRTPIDVMSRPG